MRKPIFTLATVLALGGIPLATNAFAAHNGGHVSGGHVSGGHFGGGHFGGRHFGGAHFIARPHARAFVGGHHRHFWHGHWWSNGVGPCWVWSDFYSEYVWRCD